MGPCIANFQVVSKSRSGNEGSFRPSALEDGICSNGSSVDETFDFRQIDFDLIKALKYPRKRAWRGGRCLGCLDSPRLLVKDHKVREGTSYINAEVLHLGHS